MSQKDKLQIRRPVESDIPAVCKLIAQLGLPITHEDMMYRLNLYNNNHNQSWVIVDENNHILGCSAIYVAELLHQKKRCGRIVILIIDANYRRLGLGKLLMDKAQEHAIDTGCERLEIMNIFRKDEDVKFQMDMGFEAGESSDYMYKSLLSPA